MKNYCCLALLIMLLHVENIFSQSFKRSANIVYNEEHKLKLDVYTPKKGAAPAAVFIFIHGGNWQIGNNLPLFILARGLAEKGIITVYVDYRLAHRTNYEGMAKDAATAVKWVSEHIHNYGGDSNKIYVSGHSAGGHLAALIATDDHYFKNLNIQSPIKGVILIDAFGMDIYDYMHRNSKNIFRKIYYPVFTRDSLRWRDASPVYHVHQKMPPVLMLVGGLTAKPIKIANTSFLNAVKPYHPNTKLIMMPGKEHLGMILQFLNIRNIGYDYILDFMKNNE